jgi:transcription elongation factor/antiterminator RfaH
MFPLEEKFIECNEGSVAVQKNHVTDSGGAMFWYAVYTKPRHERKVNAHLIREGMTTFLPEIKRWSRRKDRKTKVSYPIFPGYLFINTELNGGSRLKVIKTKGVVRILGNKGIPTAIPVHQIDAIQRIVDNNKEISPYPYLKRGQMVRVISGPLNGVEGIFISEKGKGKLIISVDILQRAVSVEIEETDVEPI